MFMITSWKILECPGILFLSWKILESWDSYVKFLKYHIALPKSRQPQGKSFTILKDSFNGPLMKMKLKSLEFVSKLNKFLRRYQMDQPMVPFLCNSLKEILTSLLQMFILNDTIKKANTMLKLMRIDTDDVNLHKPYDLIQIGTAAKLHVADYKKSTEFKESTLRRFYKEVCMLLASLTSHFMEKSPLKHLTVCCSSCFNPIVLADTNKHKVSKKQFSKVMEKLVATGHFKSKEADEAKDQYEKRIEELIPKYREEFANFDIFASQLDDFIIPLLPAKKLDILSKVYILIFCLSHGQSAEEHGLARIRNIKKRTSLRTALFLSELFTII